MVLLDRGRVGWPHLQPPARAGRGSDSPNILMLSYHSEMSDFTCPIHLPDGDMKILLFLCCGCATPQGLR